ncbi:hypothetical protein GWI33_010132, partial [Rhynchophorus ferrugineus]
MFSLICKSFASVMSVTVDIACEIFNGHILDNRLRSMNYDCTANLGIR